MRGKIANEGPKCIFMAKNHLFAPVMFGLFMFALAKPLG
jgi:hypothetical protein